MMFTNVSGKVAKYDAIIETNVDDFTNAIIDFTGETDSITTSNADRDAHLLSPDFFDAAQFPKINFAATSFNKLGQADFEIKGDLTMRSITKPVKLTAEFGGLMKDPWEYQSSI